MKTLENIIIEITNLTSKINTRFPELYLHLDEEPITIPQKCNPTIDYKTMKNYLDSLKQILKRYKKSHLKGN